MDRQIAVVAVIGSSELQLLVERQCTIDVLVHMSSIPNARLHCFFLYSRIEHCSDCGLYTV